MSVLLTLCKLIGFIVSGGFWFYDLIFDQGTHTPEQHRKRRFIGFMLAIGFLFSLLTSGDSLSELLDIVEPKDKKEVSFWADIQAKVNKPNVSQQEMAALYCSYADTYPEGRHVNYAKTECNLSVSSALEPSVKPTPVADAAVAPAEEPAPAPAPTEPRQAFEPEMVQLPNGKWMGKYEVTIGEYMACVDDSGCKNPEWLEEGSEYNINTGSNDFYKKVGMLLNNKHYPITGVSWNDTQAYINWLNGKTKKTYRLPTEEEWFTACQAGKTTEYCGSNNLDEVAWYNGNSGNTTHPVGQKTANAWGLKDMSGNVWEWTNSVYEGEANSRVVRGGSWDIIPVGLRSAYRHGIGASFRSSSLGFRLLQD
jgi:formylglycine-generating enzyme required for sulfatase activity